MKTLAIFFIRCYQRFISPILPRCCRYRPNCSAYAIEAIRKRGFIRGSLLAAWRIVRCNPFCKGGDDPVDPPARSANVVAMPQATSDAPVVSRSPSGAPKGRDSTAQGNALGRDEEEQTSPERAEQQTP